MTKDEWADLHWTSRAEHMVSNFRVFPRIMLGLYGYIAYETYVWFIGMDTPLPPQAAFASAIWGAGAVWLGFYVNSGSLKK